MKLYIELQAIYDNVVPDVYSESSSENDEEDYTPIEEEIENISEEVYVIDTEKNIFQFLKLIEELLDDENISWDWGGERSGENRNFRIQIISNVRSFAEESFNQVRRIFENETGFTVIDNLPEIDLSFPDDVECRDDIDDQIWAIETFCPKNSNVVWERVLPELNGGSGFGELSVADWITIVSFIFSCIKRAYRFIKRLLKKRRLERIILKIERKKNVIRVYKKPTKIYCKACRRNEYCFDVDFRMKDGKVKKKSIYTSLNGKGKMHC